MTIEVISGDLLEAFNRNEVDYIAHCVNCMGVMGSGIALQIKNDYPIVYQRYKAVCDQESDKSFLLGKSQKVNYGWESEGKAIFNLFGQQSYGTDKRQGNYGAISCAFLNILKQLPDNSTVGFPYKMCSDRAGCDWQIILEMIEFYFKDHSVRIYKL